MNIDDCPTPGNRDGDRWQWGDAVDGCRNVQIRDNCVDNRYITRDIRTQEKSDVNVENMQRFKLDYVKGLPAYLN